MRRCGWNDNDDDYDDDYDDDDDGDDGDDDDDTEFDCGCNGLELGHEELHHGVGRDSDSASIEQNLSKRITLRVICFVIDCCT